jgi:hypothetical protein
VNAAHPPRPLTPVTGTALRDATIRDYKRQAERMGIVADMAAIERQAIADCNLFDAVLRLSGPSSPAKPDPAKVAAKADALDELAAREGVDVIREQNRVIKERISKLTAVPKPDSKWAHALGRRARILSGATPSTDRRKLVSTCEIPALAWEFLRLHAWAVTRIRIGNPPRLTGEANPFDHLSLRDFVAKFEAMTYDICDRSTGRLGPWWVPK